MKQLYVAGPWPDEPFSPPAEAVHRLRYVRRIRGGEKLTIADGEGGRARCEWTGKFLVIRSRTRSCSNVRPVVVAAGLLKGDRWEFLLEKCVEIGVDRIVPLQLQHGVVRLKSAKVAARVAKWRHKAIEAFEQCGRISLPRVDAPMTLDQFVDLKLGAVAIADEGGGCAIGSWAAEQEAGTCVVIGPEGGLSGDERERLDAVGGTRVSLGPNVLRAETAAIVAGAALCRIRDASGSV